MTESTLIGGAGLDKASQIKRRKLKLQSPHVINIQRPVGRAQANPRAFKSVL